MPLYQPELPNLFGFPNRCTVTLTPLVDDPRQVLDTRGATDIEKINLHKLEGVRRGPFKETVTDQADDLLAHAGKDAPLTNLVPTLDTSLQAVTLLVYPTGEPNPEIIEIRPPNTILYKLSSHAHAVFAWLLKSPFVLSSNLFALILAALLTCASIAAPALDDYDGDDDDDDCDSERTLQRIANPSTARLSLRSKILAYRLRLIERRALRVAPIKTQK